MPINRRHRLALFVLAILIAPIFGAFPHFAFADYTGVQYMPTPTTHAGQSSDDASVQALLRFTSTSTYRVQTFTSRICTNSGTPSVSMYVWLGTSLTLGGLLPMGTSSSQTITSVCPTYATTTWTFPIPIDVVPNIALTFGWNVTSGGTLNDWILPYSADFIGYVNQPKSTTTVTFTTGGLSPFFSINASGTAPTIYNGNEVEIICTTFEIDCYLTKFTNFVFTPTDESVQEFRSLTFASSSPFGYIYDIPTAYGALMNATGSPITMSFNFTTLYDRLDALEPAGNTVTRATTTPVVYLDSCAATKASGDPYGTYVMPLLIAAFWFGFLWEIYLIAHRIF